jgi:hypothetical protein
MSQVGTIEVKGLKESLRLLNRLAPAMRREIGKEFRALAKPGATAAQELRNKGVELRGFQHQGRTGRYAWKAIAVKVDTRKARKRNASKGADWESLGVVKITTKDAASAIMDMAGKVGNIQMSGQSRPYKGRPEGHRLNGQGGHLIKKLNNQYGHAASRFMWPGAEQGLDGTENELRNLVRKVERELQRALQGDLFGIAESEGF